MAQSRDDVLSKLLSEHLSLEIINEGTKVKCKLTGHEMPYRAEAVQSYVNGKKYRRLLEKQNLGIDSYMKHLEPSTRKDHKGMLYCKLTCRFISNDAHHIQRHVQGKRFKKALKRWEECQETGEVFIPRQPLFPKDAAHEENEESVYEEEAMEQSVSDDEEFEHESEEEVEVEDDMEDLYPSSDFQLESSGEDMDDEETEKMDNAGVNGHTDKENKRKKLEDHGPNKKMKTIKGHEKKKTSKKCNKN